MEVQLHSPPTLISTWLVEIYIKTTFTISNSNYIIFRYYWFCPSHTTKLYHNLDWRMVLRLSWLLMTFCQYLFKLWDLPGSLQILFLTSYYDFLRTLPQNPPEWVMYIVLGIVYFYTEGCCLLLRPFRRSLARRVLSVHYADTVPVGTCAGIDFNDLVYM